MRDSQANDRADGWQRCALCERLVPPSMITLHHLKPRERGGTAEDRRTMCRPCHKQLHAMFSNKELEQRLASIEALRAAPQVATFLAWIRKQKPDRNFATRRSAGHPESSRRKPRRY